MLTRYLQRFLSQQKYFAGVPSTLRHLTISNICFDAPKSVVAAKSPYVAEVVSGKKYSWCACGLSKKQPFCDGNHKKTGLRPFRMIAEETCEMYFCGCKQTKTPPFCDGTHMGDSVQSCTIGQSLE